MYAWCVAVHINNISIVHEPPPASVLLSQPPHDVAPGNSAIYHYTWGSIFKEGDKEVWRFDKRDYTADGDALKVCGFAVATFAECHSRCLFCGAAGYTQGVWRDDVWHAASLPGCNAGMLHGGKAVATLEAAGWFDPSWTHTTHAFTIYHQVPNFELPPQPWREGAWKLQDGLPIGETLHETLTDMLTVINKAVDTLPDLSSQ